ncbi:solute carrier family 35 member e3 [Anaeramoeba ignava]|uniref:Solute carrier family 35 member e3 n=1 Tax=Anaeramoeba ignava TaxID=1746090 RepID=A0A9Q0LII1_ANAIG|nr:solute carrier family 35 member e3 [Anaeramoeba ignava]
MDPFSEIVHFNYTPKLVFFIFTSAFLSFFVNISIYLLIGKTSALTYNIFGHTKSVCILIAHFVVFKSPLSWKQIFGILLTLAGVFKYTQLKLQKENKPNTPLPTVDKGTLKD